MTQTIVSAQQFFGGSVLSAEFEIVRTPLVNAFAYASGCSTFEQVKQASSLSQKIRDALRFVFVRNTDHFFLSFRRFLWFPLFVMLMCWFPRESLRKKNNFIRPPFFFSQDTRKKERSDISAIVNGLKSKEHSMMSQSRADNENEVLFCRWSSLPFFLCRRYFERS